jgi:hypothetical protein
MKRTGIGAILALAAVSWSGCGTVANLADGVVHPNADWVDSGPKIYGGIEKDFDAFQNSNASMGTTKLAAMLLLAEIPLTLVGDTLTLPITIWVQEKRAAAVADGLASTKERSDPLDSMTTNVSLGQPRPRVPRDPGDRAAGRP